MGQLFQRTYRGADGTLKTCKTWTLRYYRNGRPYQESTELEEHGAAKRLLKLREGDIAKGKHIDPANLKLTIDDATTDVLNDFKANGKRSIAVVQRRITKHLLPYFTGRRLS